MMDLNPSVARFTAMLLGLRRLSNRTVSPYFPRLVLE